MDIVQVGWWVRLVAAICCTIAPAFLLLSNFPMKEDDGSRRWELSSADWFLRFTTYGFTWCVAYGFWEAMFHGVPVAPRTWIVALASVYLLIASVILLDKRQRQPRKGMPLDKKYDDPGI